MLSLLTSLGVGQGRVKEGGFVATKGRFAEGRSRRLLKVKACHLRNSTQGRAARHYEVS